MPTLQGTVLQGLMTPNPMTRLRPMFRASAQVAIGLVAAMGFLAATALTVPARAQPAAATCSAAYFDALTALRATKGDDLASAVTTLRAADPALPGRWLYAQALFPKSARKQPVVEPRPCAEQVKVAGRFRCRSYAQAPAPSEPALPSELTIAAAPAPDELRVLKAVADLVDGRGSVPDVGNNGRYTWVSLRAAADLKTYISQPQHEALCSGGPEVAEFYANSLKPLQKRRDDVGELVKKSYALAAARVAEAVKLSNAEEATRAPADATIQPLAALVADAVRPIVTPDEAATVAAETTALAALRRAKLPLIAAQVAALQGEDAARRDRIQATGRALRIIEGAAYAEIYAARYARFASTVLSMPEDIKAAHGRTCTCRP